MLDRHLVHTYSLRLRPSPRTPPSPTLISLDSGPAIPTLLEAQDELDFLAIDHKAKKAAKVRSSNLTPLPKFLVDLDEADLVTAAKEHLRKGTPVEPLRDRSKQAARVAPLVDVDFNESLLLSAPHFWKPKPKDAAPPSHRKAYIRISERGTPSVSCSSPPPAFHPARVTLPTTPAGQQSSYLSDPFIVSPTPRRALPLQLRDSAPIFRPLRSAPPRPATPSSLSPVSSSERVGDIYITSPAKVSKLFQADIRSHYFPPIPKIFWGRSEEQRQREREKTALASDSDEEGEIVETHSQESHKRSRYQKLWEEQRIGRTPTKRPKYTEAGPSSVENLGEDYSFRRAAHDRGPNREDVPLNATARPYVTKRDIHPRRPTVTSALVDVSIPTPEPVFVSNNGAASDESDLDDDMEHPKVGADSDLVSAFGPFEGMMNKSAYRRLLSMPSVRTNVPPELITRTRMRPLDSSILSAWSSTEPTPAARDQVGRLLNRLTTAINRRLGAPRPSRQKRPRFEVDVFGSVSWGGETGQSGDLDLVVIDHDMPYGYEPLAWKTSSTSPPPSRATNRSRPRTPKPGLPPVYNLWRLAEVLRGAGMQNAFAINATTPIVKFSAPGGPGQRSLDCDINVNDLGGWYNSSLILHYCLISPFVLRPLIYTLKRWASAFDLNDASGATGTATLSSYCLTLMAIAYLQHRGVLPNLQASVAARSADNPGSKKDIIWVAWSRSEGIKANIGFDASPPAGWTSAEPNMTVGEAVRGFFFFFAGSGGNVPGGRMEWDSKIISILRGGIADRAAKRDAGAKAKSASLEKLERLRDNGLHLTVAEDIMQQVESGLFEVEKLMGRGDRGIQPVRWGDNPIVVQDPFLWEKNCAASMSKKGKTRFFDQLDATHHLLSRDPDATLDDMLFNANPPTPRPPSVSSRGRGGGQGRGRGRGRGLWSPSPKPGQAGSLLDRLGPPVTQR